jgi:DNA polymerase-3 subunit alpha
MLADRRAGQKGLFDDDSEPAAKTDERLPEVPEWNDKELLINEKEVLGFYLSSHPLAPNLRPR